MIACLSYASLGCWVFFLFLIKKKNPTILPEAPPPRFIESRRSGVASPLGSGPPSAGEANFAGEQESHYGEEDGEDEEHIGGAHHRVVGQLVRLAPHLVDVEAYGKDERRHAEQDHWRKEEEREKKKKS